MLSSYSFEIKQSIGFESSANAFASKAVEAPTIWHYQQEVTVLSVECASHRTIRYRKFLPEHLQHNYPAPIVTVYPLGLAAQRQSPFSTSQNRFYCNVVGVQVTMPLSRTRPLYHLLDRYQAACFFPLYCLEMMLVGELHCQQKMDKCMTLFADWCPKALSHDSH